MNDNKDLTIFLHVPKTGGTTLNSIFIRQYQESAFHNHDTYDRQIIPLSELNQEQKAFIRAVAGHHYYGVHELFNKSFQYFTMLRHPVDRVLSLYFYLKESNYPGYEWMKEMTIEEFVQTPSEAQNNQTGLLCGYSMVPNVKIAKKRIDAFEIVGITERFDESLFLLKKAFNWENIEYVKHNITKSRLSKREIPAEVISLILQNNEMDLEIYEYARGLLERKLKLLSKQEKGELKHFLKTQNRKFSKE
ncbi:sulfotransferase family 2 domain-containing protein [Bacillus sp. B1-b2]|uniref:sulfotransferase family 2 domain-containing protein n=1 Tax=Bacillus sp. B1-b2 TaxID=2653201 RepID=UPI001869812C|nr:sulfotransferase family 2 domain-containing protein [Bacillus sp. B1-b2]